MAACYFRLLTDFLTHVCFGVMVIVGVRGFLVHAGHHGAPSLLVSLSFLASCHICLELRAVCSVIDVLTLY
jgi:hypothetical protein